MHPVNYDEQTDGNLFALAKYEREQDRNELAYTAYVNELHQVIGDMVDEIVGLQQAINERYGRDTDLCYYMENER